jgi:hypothetical protein
MKAVNKRLAIMVVSGSWDFPAGVPLPVLIEKLYRIPKPGSRKT